MPAFTLQTDFWMIVKSLAFFFPPCWYYLAIVTLDLMAAYMRKRHHFHTCKGAQSNRGRSRSWNSNNIQPKLLPGPSQEPPFYQRPTSTSPEEYRDAQTQARTQTEDTEWTNTLSGSLPALSQQSLHLIAQAWNPQQSQQQQLYKSLSRLERLLSRGHTVGSRGKAVQGHRTYYGMFREGT